MTPNPNPNTKIDPMIGRQFGLLTIMSRDPKRRSTFICRCQCGGVKHALHSSLLTGTKSCGCLQKGRTIHGHARKATGEKTTTYIAWLNMRARQQDQDPWPDFNQFLQDLGPKPESARLKKRDRRAPHSPTNTYWSTK